VQAPLLSSLSPRYPGGLTIASTHAAAATTSATPSGRVRRRLPNLLSSGSRKASIERGRCGARPGALRAVKGEPGQFCERHDAGTGPSVQPDIQAVARNHERPAPAAGAICDGRVHRCDARRLRADPDVESVDIDQRRFPHAVPNDPLFTGQWYEQATQPAGIDA